MNITRFSIFSLAALAVCSLGPVPLAAQQEVKIEDGAAVVEIPAEALESGGAAPVDGAVPEGGATFEPGLDEPLPLIPGSPSDWSSTPGQGGRFPDSGGKLQEATADQLRRAVKIRQLKTVVLREPAIVTQKELADTAKTYEGRRTALRNYYTLIARSIVKKDASLKESVEADLAKRLSALEQKRVHPSVLIEPIEPVPGSRPEATPEVTEPVKKKKKKERG